MRNQGIKVTFTDRAPAFYTMAVFSDIITETNVVEVENTVTGEILFETDRTPYKPTGYHYDWNLRMLVRDDEKRPDLLADKLDTEIALTGAY